MSGDDPLDDSDPGQPDFAEMLGAMVAGLGALGSAGGPPSDDHVAQLAAAIATEGTPEPNIEPGERIRLSELARVAELHVTQITGLSAGDVEVRAVNRGQWVRAALRAHGPLLHRLADSLGSLAQTQLDEAAVEGFTPEDLPPGIDPSMMNSLFALGPMLGNLVYSMLASGTVGRLAARSFGSFDVPLPRHTDTIDIIVSNLSAFAEEWELDLDELMLWVSAQELALHTALGRAAFGGRLEELLGAYVAAMPTDFSTDAMQRLVDEFETADPSSLVMDPNKLLGSLRTPEQDALRPRIDAAVAALEGWTAWVVDSVAERLLPEAGRVTEALRRRRVTTDEASRFVERLFGLELSQPLFDRGRAFVSGVVDRGGDEALERLVTDPDALPTPNEIDAPGLWLARLGIEFDAPEADEVGIDVPDFPDEL